MSNESGDADLYVNGTFALNFSISDANAGVPEPSTFGFLGLGIAGLVIKLRRRK